MIKVTSLVLHHHIAEGCAMSWPIDPRFNIFNDPPGMEVGGRGGTGGSGGFRETGRAARNGGGEGEWGPRGLADRLGAPSYAEVCMYVCMWV